MGDAPYGVAHIDEIDPVGRWLPIRRRLGIGAFGVNAYKARPGDDRVIDEHDETSVGHEELYVVVEGSATFTVADETIDAPAGTLVFVRDPALRRGAVAQDPRTTILAVGAKPGEAFTPSAWEENADIIPLFERGEYREAKERLEQALARHPNAGGLLYNLACAESRLGEIDAAREHLSSAVELYAGFAELAQTDPDLEALRG